MDLNFDNNFKSCVFGLKLQRCHPNTKRDYKQLLHFIITYGVFVVLFFIMMFNISIGVKNKDFTQTCQTGSLTLINIVILFQQIVLLWKRDVLLDLMSSMNNDYKKMKSLPLHEQEIMNDYIRKGKHMCWQWVMISSCGFGTFPVKNIILLSYHYIKGEPKLIPVLELVYPSMIEENKEELSVYLAIYAVLMFYGFYAACMYLAFVPLGPIFMLHICGQLDIVEKKMELIFESEEGIDEKLKEIIIKLQNIYSSVEKVLDLFRLYFEVTLKASSISLPIFCYEVIQSVKRGGLSLEFMTFIFGGFLLCFSPCYYSDLLMEKSANVRNAIYSCGWERRYNRKALRTIAIIMTRDLKPVAIKTLFRTVCLEALTDLFQQSYALFNVMLAMWK